MQFEGRMNGGAQLGSSCGKKEVAVVICLAGGWLADNCRPNVESGMSDKLTEKAINTEASRR